MAGEQEPGAEFGVPLVLRRESEIAFKDDFCCDLGCGLISGGMAARRVNLGDAVRIAGPGSPSGVVWTAASAR